jgi:hypothetical protein
MIFYNTYNLFVNLAVNQGSSIQIEEETVPFFLGSFGEEAKVCLSTG